MNYRIDDTDMTYTIWYKYTQQSIPILYEYSLCRGVSATYYFIKPGRSLREYSTWQTPSKGKKADH